LPGGDFPCGYLIGEKKMMNEQNLLQLFVQFGLAGLIGFLLGLEREMSAKKASHIGIRDFVFFALLGATSAFIAGQYGNPWIIIAVFGGVTVLLITQYWASHEEDIGITTEMAAILTFTLGVLMIRGAKELAIALAILASGILFQKEMIQSLRQRIKTFELQAVLKFLIITFIILPVLPQQTLDNYLSMAVGHISATDVESGQVEITLDPDKRLKEEDEVRLYIHGWETVGNVVITDIIRGKAYGQYTGDRFDNVTEGTSVRKPFGTEVLNTALSALKPYKLWLIVVLVSFISFVGYALIKIIGHGAGIGLTGLVGGLVSSTVTTLSFARRSVEFPDFNRNFAVAVVLASSIMFPRLLLEIAVVNQALMKNMALPILVMGITGLCLAAYFYLRTGRDQTENPAMNFDNPFSLKSAINFALVFAAILVITRLATIYLGSTWLPLVSIVSGLTDADAIAFSISDAQQAQMISLDWASFNLVLGALSNTFMKLFLVFTLGHRGLFRHLLASFTIIGVAGIITMVFYYDFTGITG
jgi:uncharacterized membrane protein (DUF4010 family)